MYGYHTFRIYEIKGHIQEYICSLFDTQLNAQKELSWWKEKYPNRKFTLITL